MFSEFPDSPNWRTMNRFTGTFGFAEPFHPTSGLLSLLT
jgi:hypothetical protein